MADRIKQGDEGERVGQLHRWLRAAGRSIDEAEVAAARFGASTLDALIELQTRLGVAVTGELDELTAASFEERERAGRLVEIAVVDVVIEEPPSTPRRRPSRPPPGGGGGGSTPPPGPGDSQGVVHGHLVDADGAPLGARLVAAFDKGIRTETRIGAATTDAGGAYEIRYRRPRPLNLVVRAYDAAGRAVAESATAFAAPADVEIDLTTAGDGVVRTASRYSTLLAAVTAALGGTPLGDLVEDKDTHEIQFLARAITEPFNDVAHLYLARKLGAKDALRDETLFGIFAASIPASLDAALAGLPDAGLDAAFAGQVERGVLAHSRDALSRALAAALSDNVIPASYAAAQDAELARLDELRRQSAASTPYVRGKTPLGDLLAAGAVAEPVKTAFIQHFADQGGRLGPVWKALRADKSLSKADLLALKTTLSAGELLGGNVPLVKDTLARLSGGALPGLRHLARQSQSDWETLLKKVDPEGASIPPVIADDTVDQRISRFAQALTQRFTSRFPTSAFAGGLARAETPPLAQSQELLAIFDAHPGLELLRTNIDAYVASRKVSVSPAALGELKLAQRLLRLSPHYTSVEALAGAGFRSAQSIYLTGKSSFLSQMSQPLGSAAIASAAFARAEATYAASLTAFGQYNLALNGINFAVMTSPVPDPAQLKSFPNLTTLFGSLDYCECPDCRSVLSPAAYLVDLLQYLAPLGARDPLLARRPDLQSIALSCDNTNVTLPYIDLVNELLEAAIAPPASPSAFLATTGTSAERRAEPQQITQAAYDRTAAVAFPLSLPFDLPFARTSAYLTGLGTSLPAVLSLFRGAPAGPSEAVVTGALLGLSPAMQHVITATDGRQPWERWGLDATTNDVVDPKSPSDPSKNATGAWTAVLGRIPIFVHRSGLSLRELYQLVECSWVTGGGDIEVRPGFKVVDDREILSCDTEAMRFSGAEGNVLEDFFDRAGRFIRLWRATGLAMWQLDWALGHSAGGLCDDAFLLLLAQAIALSAKLHLPLEEILAFYYPLETRDVTTHLGDEDATIASTYTAVFRNPALLSAWGDVFVDVASGASFPAPAALGVDRALQALTAALGLGADDIQAILATVSTPAPAPNALSLDLLSTLFRHARLASSLSLSIPDLLSWITLTEAPPFSGPAGTIETLRRLAVLQRTGLAPADLDYLLRHRSEAETALAFTAAGAASVFNSFRAALAKLPEATLTDERRVHDLVTQSLATALSATALAIDPVLGRTSLLPLSAATITDLLAKTSAGAYLHDAAFFPSLTAAFTTVAKATKLLAALRPSGIELGFLVQHAGDFGWLDPSTLPLAPATSSRFTAFERLLQALALDQRQRARTPKLFDVLAARLAAAPADATAAIAALAPALSARADDITALAVALGAAALDGSSVLRETPAGSLADVAVLTSIAAALDLVARYGMSGGALVLLGGGAPSAASATAARATFQAQYDQTQWFDVIQPIEDTLRLKRRDALVAFLLAPRPGLGLPPPADRGFLSVDDMFGYYLVDPEMSCCALTTRLLQASLSIQTFVQRCYLGLELPIKVNADADPRWNEWSWRSQFRLWQANRQVFLYPENYLLPELRRDKSPFFSELENDLRQSHVDADAAETAFESYLRKLIDVSKLVVSAHYHETKADGSRVLHVFARTRGTPARWYYRQRAEAQRGHGTWTAWEALNLDINSDHVLPVIWDRRLHLVWAIFKAETALQGTQTNPTDANSAPPARRLWAVELAISERRAGQWQAKRTLGEKMFVGPFLPQDLPSPLAFGLRAAEDPSSNLVVDLYFGVLPIGKAVLTSPDDPLLVTQALSWLPKATDVDAGREPSFSLVTVAPSTGLAWLTDLPLLATPNSFGFSGQDLTRSGATGPLNVLSVSGKSPATTVTLLSSIQSPHIIIPQQEPVFDSADPFFVSDAARIFFVEPHYYTVSSSPTELDDLAYIPQWSTSYAFSPFHHPFARTFLRELEVGGIDQLMRRELQKSPETVRGWHFDFNAAYGPTSAVTSVDPLGYPRDEVDFSTDGAYALYNWELFYHAPMFVASLLTANHRYEDAKRWLGYIFDPTDSSADDAPGRYWRTLPLNQLQQGDWLAQQIEQLLTLLAVDKKRGIADPDASALQDWVDHPFDPHRVARLRIGAYGKATVMKYLDNLIAWGDALFGEDTMESVNQAEQLYVLASMILGPAPDRVRLPARDQPSNAQTATYASIKDDLDQFSNVLVSIENVIPVPPPSLQKVSAVTPPPTLPQIAVGDGATLFFCIPPNDTLLAYWDTVADRLDKIRNCKNLAGTVRQLALYAPPINPLLLIEAGGAGGSLSALGTTYQPIYRFATYLQRANELVGDVRSFGALVLSALEKKDAEALSVLRSGQELDVLTRTRDVKVQQLTEATDQITALQRQKDVTVLRRDFYRDIKFMNPSEIVAISLQGAALVANAAAVVLDLVAGGAHVVPQFMGGAAGFGGSPMVTVTEGGEEVGNAASSWATGLRGLAGILSGGGQIASTIGSYQRRSDEWDLQHRTADAELVHLDAQLTAANDRQIIATTELALHDRQIENAQAIDDFLNDKYTNGQLYDFMLTRLTTVHTQAYQLAVDLAQRANAAYNYELGTAEIFIKPDYWDSQHQGLLAAESLLFDLRRMEAAYLDANIREMELTKHVSLALTQPASLVTLRQKGSATVSLPEELFDRDHPGHLFRRIRSVAVTIPCVTGPYTGVNATLTLTSSAYRTGATTIVSTGSGGDAQLATSSGQNDAGLFDANLRDERWLPFEGKGAISTWALELRAEDNAFDPSTITDVVLHLRYTARPGGDAEAVRTALKPKNGRAILVSARDTFADAYYRFLNPAGSGVTQQVLSLALQSALFPFSNLGAPQMSSIDVYVVSNVAPGANLAATFGPDGGAASPLTIVADTGTGPSWTSKGPATLAAAHPGPFTLTVAVADVPAALAAPGSGLLDAAKVEDVLLVINYKIV